MYSINSFSSLMGSIMCVWKSSKYVNVNEWSYGEWWSFHNINFLAYFLNLKFNAFLKFKFNIFLNLKFNVFFNFETNVFLKFKINGFLNFSPQNVSNNSVDLPSFFSSFSVMVKLALVVASFQLYSSSCFVSKVYHHHHFDVPVMMSPFSVNSN